MPHHYNCCDPGCHNSFRNSPNLHFYRIPKNEEQRKIYKHILRNETLKMHSEATRVCSEHFEGGEKLSRNHIPSIFPWTIGKETNKKREIIRHPLKETTSRPKKKPRVESTTNEEVQTACDSYVDNNIEVNIATEVTGCP